METFVVIVALLGFVGLRVFFAVLIANAAARRRCGYLGWSISALVIGPLIVWIIYLAFVHWRPIVTLADLPSESDEMDEVEGTKETV